MPAPQDFEKMIRELKARITKLEQARPLSNTGLSCPAPGVTNVDGQLQGSGFDGDLDTDDVGTTGWALDASKAALPELLLRPGSIGNDSLTNPVTADINGASAIGGSVSTTSTVKATTTIIVPAGFTMAIVRADAIGQAVNSTASADYIYVDANINGITGGEMYNAVASGFGGSALGVANRIVSGLSGGDIITCTAMSRTSNAGWAANAANQWTIHAQAIFMR